MGTPDLFLSGIDQIRSIPLHQELEDSLCCIPIMGGMDSLSIH